MPSPAVLRSLPDPELMKARLRTFAMLDAILAPDMRSFEWHPKWGRRESMGAFKDGEGNAFFAWFTPRGAVIRGFDHESVMSPFRREPPAPWPGIWDGLPPALAAATREPAFVPEEITFAAWNVGRGWSCGPVKPPPRSSAGGRSGADADGSKDLLGCFAKGFARWAAGYYGAPLDRAALARVWWGKEPIDRATASALNADYDPAAIASEAALTGHPVAADLAAPRKVRARGVAQAGPKAPARSARPAARSFGAAEFTVRCAPDHVALVVHGKVVAKLGEDVYEELFDHVKARLERRRR